MRSLSLSIRFNVLKDIMGYIFSQNEPLVTQKQNSTNSIVVQSREWKDFPFCLEGDFKVGPVKSVTGRSAKNHF